MSEKNILFTPLLEYSKIDDLKNQVSKLQAQLENEDFIFNRLECLLQTLEHCFSICTTESLDEQIFNKILPKVHYILLQIVKAINDITSHEVRIDDLKNVKHKLHICDKLLLFLWKCVQHVSAIGKISVHHVASLCSILPETIKIIFKHCKDGPKTYGILLSGSKQELRTLFLRVSTICKLFFATLVDVIVFDTNEESETELLIKVINTYGVIASITNGMDMKTNVEISEAFTKLAIVYQNIIKHASPSSVTTYLAQMAKDTSCLLSTIKNQKDKNVERTIAITVRLLKILEKLIATYNTFLTYETLLYLIDLSVQIHRCTSISIIKSSEETFSINVTYFLDIIFNHVDFKQAYYEYGKKNDVHRLSYHLLTIAVMKKLNGMCYENYCEWIVDSDSILDVAFIYIEHVQEEICVGELLLSDTYGIGEQPRLANIYEATLVSVCDLVRQISPSDFHALELLLLKHLLSGHFWSSLLSSDVWCFIGRWHSQDYVHIISDSNASTRKYCRLGTLQLCADHVKYLAKLSAVLTEKCNNIETIVLDNTISRLYELLTEDAKIIFLDELVDLDIKYTSNLYLLATKIKIFHSERLICKLEDLLRTFSDIQEHPTLYNWERFMQFVSAMQIMDYNYNNDVIGDLLIKMWTFVVNIIIECESKQLGILSDFIVVLLNSTHLDKLRNNALDSILTSIATSCIYMPSRAKIKLCQYLQENVKNFDRCNRQSASVLIELFSCLLEDENPWVCQEALESFEHIGHVCSEQIVAKIARALAKISFINDIMQAYLSNMLYYVLEGFVNVYDYLRHIVRTAQDYNKKHMCYEYEESEQKDKIPKLENEKSDVTPTTSMQLNEQAEKLYQDLTKTLEGQISISKTTCRKLINVLEKILNTSEK